jgi:uncharacterized repeat protein (TIGR01451 family)
LWAADNERTFAMCGMNRNLATAFVLLISLGYPAKSGAVDFAPPKTYRVGTSPTAIVVGDFNGDGKPDIAVLNSGSRNVSILLGNGDGTFQPAKSFDVGGDNPSSIAVADFNGDGKLDLEIAIPGDIPAPPTTFPTCTQSSVNLMLGNGDGTFQAARRAVTVDSSNLSLTVGDLNGDAKTDLVVLRSQRDPACPVGGGNIFLGGGDGSFQTAGEIAATAPVLVADFNGDGKPDLVAGGGVLLGNGDGTFRALVALPLPGGCGFLCQQSFSNVVAADFNGDGKLDLAIGRATRRCDICSIGTPRSFSTLVLLGNGDGTFQAPQTAGPGGFFLVTGDFNGDGKPDIAASPTIYAGSSLFHLLLGKGDGTFPSTFDFDTGAGPVFLAAVDLKGDKLADIVSANLMDATVNVLLNTSATSGSDLSARISATPEPVSVTQNLTYTVQAINSGPQDATNMVLKNTLPAGVNFASATSNEGSCAQANLVVTCNVSKLVSGDSLTATIVVIPTTTGSADDRASTSATETDTLLGNNSASHTTHVDPMFSLKVTKSGAGSGTISGASWNRTNQINCGSICTASLPTATQVNLQVTPDAGSVFGGWRGTCSQDFLSPGCGFTMNADLTLTATFDIGPNFFLAADATSLTMKRGSSITTNITILPEGNSFDSPIALSCSVAGPSPMPSCSFSPSSVTPGANPANSMLTITAAALSASLIAPWFDQGARLYAAWLPLGLLGCVLATGFDKKRRRLWGLCLLMLAATILPAACGGGSSTPIKGPPPQNFTVTVTATSGAIQHATNVTVTVQ